MIMKKNKSKNKEPEFSNEFLAKLEGPVVFIDPPLETAVSLMTTLGPARLEELGTPLFFHFDDTKAQQLEEVIRDNDWPARTIVFPDLWDIEPCQSLVWFPRRGENRELKLDLVEQSWHALKPGGNLLVCLPTKDLGLTFPMIRKIYGTIHEFPGKVNSFFWTEREGSHPRRRHEIAFSVKLVKTGPYDLISRPGVHCYGAIDEGTRTLCEVIEIEEGNRILDICCGAGVAGIFAANKAGPTGEVVFADGSARVRTVALINAQANNIAKHSAVSVEALGNLPDEHFDVILAHPPGFGTGALTERIIEEASRLLGPQGRFYLLTKQPRETAPIVIANFRKADALVHRSYTVLVHNRAMPEGILAEFEDDDFTQ
jgi:16S rRNA G1207 methylase RsmC